MRETLRYLALLMPIATLHVQPSLAEEAGAVSEVSPHALHDGISRAELRERMIERFSAELALSIEQQAVLADILRDYGSRVAALMKEGAAIGWSIMDVAPKNPQYTIDTETRAQAAAETAAQWVRTVTELRNAVYSILTQEQIGTLEQRIQERRDAWQQRLTDSGEDSSSAP